MNMTHSCDEYFTVLFLSNTKKATDIHFIGIVKLARRDLIWQAPKLKIYCDF